MGLRVLFLRVGKATILFFVFLLRLKTTCYLSYLLYIHAWRYVDMYNIQTRYIFWSCWNFIWCILVQDGLTWLLNPPEQDLPLILADNGFDVWIVNSRGTRFSRRHTSMSPSEPVLFQSYFSLTPLWQNLN